MAHTDQHKGNKPIPANPKPEDEVQLHIETVTPDTEKEAPQTNPANTETTKYLKDRKQADEDEAIDNTTAEHTDSESAMQKGKSNERQADEG